MSTSATPILDTLRALLKFKDSTTISEIAATAGIKRQKVLETINANGHMIFRNRKSGKITSEIVRKTFIAQLWEKGKFFRPGEDNYGAAHTLEFKEHAELRVQLSIDDWAVGLGDCYRIRYVPDTEENRNKLRVDGCTNLEALDVDDRLWKEDSNG